MADPVTGYLPEVYVNGVEGGQADVDPANNIIIDLVKQCWESISRYWIRTRCSVTRWLELLARMVWRVSHHSCHLIIFGDCLAYFADQCSQKRQQNNIYNARTERVWMDCFRSWAISATKRAWNLCRYRGKVLLHLVITASYPIWNVSELSLAFHRLYAQNML